MRHLSKVSLLGAVVLSVLSGCSTQGDYFLKDAFPFKEVCIVDNKQVPASFFLALRTAVEDKGLEVKTVKSAMGKDNFCQAYINYSATYQTKAAQTFISSARLVLVQKDKNDSVIVEMKKNKNAPDSLLDPMTDPVPVVRDLVNRLLPRNTPW